MLAPRRQAC